jgi:tetraacyldisaccharide 4'-kinase
MTRGLLFASRVLDAVNALAGGAYRVGLRRTRRVEVPVVSVGNIAVGGTGKTPLVAALAGELLLRGARPVILTRGYRRRGRGPVVVRPGQEVPWTAIGDEPALLARVAGGAALVVDADRVRGARTAVRDLAATHLLLDDGFQHWRLARDVDIVTVDADDPLCERRPRREHPRSLARADAIVVTGTDEAALHRAAGRLARFAPAARVVLARVVATGLHRGAALLPPTTLRGQRVVALAGIAGPERFVATLRALGAEVVATVVRPDHYPWPEPEVVQACREAELREALAVTTAKDSTRMTSACLAALASLEVSLEPLAGGFAALLEPVLRTPLPPTTIGR